MMLYKYTKQSSSWDFHNYLLRAYKNDKFLEIALFSVIKIVTQNCSKRT